MLRWFRRRHRLISILDEGEVATIAGVVKLADRKLAGPISGRTCAIYDARQWLGIGMEARSLAARNFWVEDASGRALVRIPVGYAHMPLDDMPPGRREGIVGEGDPVYVRGRVTFHVVPDPWQRGDYRMLEAVPILYGDRTKQLVVWRRRTP